MRQEELTDKVEKKWPTYRYPAQPLLGFSATDQALIHDALLRRLGNFFRDDSFFLNRHPDL
jgi:hypothetical protein